MGSKVQVIQRPRPGHFPAFREHAEVGEPALQCRVYAAFLCGTGNTRDILGTEAHACLLGPQRAWLYHALTDQGLQESRLQVRCEHRTFLAFAELILCSP